MNVPSTRLHCVLDWISGHLNTHWITNEKQKKTVSHAETHESNWHNQLKNDFKRLRRRHCRTHTQNFTINYLFLIVSGCIYMIHMCVPCFVVEQKMVLYIFVLLQTYISCDWSIKQNKCHRCEWIFIFKCCCCFQGTPYDHPKPPISRLFSIQC